jgi:hypothetical protein
MASSLPDPEKASAAASDDILDILQEVSALDPAHPFYWSSTKKWAIVTVYCALEASRVKLDIMRSTFGA